MTRPHIRAATIDDAVALSCFARDAFHDTFAADNAPSDMEAYLREAFSPERQAAELADPHRCCLLATLGGDLVGYASLMQDAANPAVVAAHPVELERFYVARAWHGRGLADLLMQTAVGQARAWGTDVVWLGVWERNARAIRFYEKQGYETVGAQTFRLGSDLQRDCVMRVRLA